MSVLMWLVWLILLLIALTVATIFAYPFAMRAFQKESSRKSPQHGVIKHDWLPTGRIDFATRLDAVNAQNKEQPSEFKLLVEERRIVESIAGNENLEIQWRLATLSEAKAVVTQYHKYLSENSLIKTVSDYSEPQPAVKSDSAPLRIATSANDGSATPSDAS